jgi:hypothetical protein
MRLVAAAGSQAAAQLLLLSVGLAIVAGFPAVFIDVEVHEECQEGDHVEEQQFGKESRVGRRIVAVCGLRRSTSGGQ